MLAANLLFPVLQAIGPIKTSCLEMVGLIQYAWQRRCTGGEYELGGLYSLIGEDISGRLAAVEEGKSVVDLPAQHLAGTVPRLAGLFGVTLWRILRFFEPYRDDPELLPLMGALPWTHNLLFWGSPVLAALAGWPWVISKNEDWSHLDISSTCRKNRIRGAYSSLGCSD